MPDCFIIMPITTPQHLLEIYDNDVNHFEHILSYLFIPAIKQAGYNPILPTRKGSENIQAEIIKNLETADMVFCDISCYNPNVYFELGCRTALNKPVCYVKDDLTSSIPFDTGTITHHTYKSKLHPWVIEKEIPTLKNHFLESVQSSKGENSLWKYFGLRNVAKPYLTIGNDDSKIDLISMEISSVKDMIKNINDKQMQIGISQIEEDKYVESENLKNKWYSVQTNDYYEIIIKGIYKLLKDNDSTLENIYQSGLRKLRFTIKSNGTNINTIQEYINKLTNRFGFEIDTVFID